jgi:biopolymer transport protein ExbB
MIMKMKTKYLALMVTILVPLGLWGQTPNESSLAKVAEDFQKRLDRVTIDLAQHRKEVEEEKVPLTKRLAELEEKIIEARKEYDQVVRVRDSRTLDVTNLKAQIKSKEDTSNYLSNLLDEFVRNSEGRFHQSEAERYGQTIEENRNTALNANLPLEKKLQARLDSLNLLVTRLESGSGGDLFDGPAVNNKTGVVTQGKVLLLGPIGFFATEDGSQSGLADSQLNSASTVVRELPLEANPKTIRDVLFTGKGVLPVDATRGSAFKVEQTKDTVADQIRKGGPVMYPIVILGAVAVLIGLLKWVQIALVKIPSNKKVKKLLAALDAGQTAEAEAIIVKNGGHVGKMMKAASVHYKDPPTMMEEAMFECVLDAKASLGSWIPFIKIAAAVEPLLGLLGTVTGMINTFKLITIFGTGDASTFSSGISEALLTTMWGLVTAIPALLMAAFLSRKARTTLDDMEKLAVRMMNHRNHQETVRNRGADQTDVDSDEMGGGKTVTEKPISEVKTKPIPEVQVGGEDEGLSPGLAPNPV